MQAYSHGAFTVAGYKITTTNKDRQSGKDIGAAWNRWRTENLGELVQGRLDDTVHCVYFNYVNPANPEERGYDLLIGYMTADDTAQTSDLITVLHIPSQKYMYAETSGEMPQALLEQWKSINDAPMSEVPRSFGYDIDFYTQAGVTTAVSVE